MQVLLYEDRAVEDLGPLTSLRPAYDLRCGALLLREKLEIRRPSWRVILAARPRLADWLAEAYPDRLVDAAIEERTLALSGRVLVDDALLRALERVETETLLTSGGMVVGAMLGRDVRGRLAALASATPAVDAMGELLGIKDTLEIPARVVAYPWELVRLTSEELDLDASLPAFSGGIEGAVHEAAHILEPARVSIGEGASIGPGVVLDATDGHITVAPGARIMPNAVVLGPAFVGAGTVIKAGAKIYGGTSIGERCKVGGEVEASVIHSYSNKQHEGFLGHSYLGSWVNLGASTDTSDLKNTYGTVRVELGGRIIDTTSMFVGATIGDHVKTAIGTKLATGAVIGVFANIAVTGIVPRSVPAFSWSVGDQVGVFELDKAVETARLVMSRRGVEMTTTMEGVIRGAFATTRGAT